MGSLTGNGSFKLQIPYRTKPLQEKISNFYFQFLGYKRPTQCVLHVSPFCSQPSKPLCAQQCRTYDWQVHSSLVVKELSRFVACVSQNQYQRLVFNHMQTRQSSGLLIPSMFCISPAWCWLIQLLLCITFKVAKPQAVLWELISNIFGCHPCPC